MVNNNAKRITKKKKFENLKKLVFVCALCIIILVTATYAWFTGLEAVSVEPFEIEVSAADSMEVSLNGRLWSDNIKITEEGVTNNVQGEYGDAINQKAYYGNTNNWPTGEEDKKGLYPLSTIGQMDKTASRMIFFGKSSLSTSPGGYKLLSSRIDNYQYATEPDYEQKFTGYIAFDLFIKNFSGTKYITGPESDNSFEEAIYLTTDSEVKIDESGVASSGIQNSVRVAFAQVGRVSAYNTNEEIITGMTCTDHVDASNSLNNTTGLCRKAQIWEPNDKDHVSAALAWYNKSCLKRIAAPMEDSSYVKPEAVLSEDDQCKPIKKVLKEGGNADNPEDYEYKPLQTYAIAREIKYTDSVKVDIYDGPDYNRYQGNTIEEVDYYAQDESDRIQPLVAYDYFTDTEKNLIGKDRPTFITLAPNSITKVRVYVFIEGQDIDNFDYAQVGKKVSVKFGFTKQRFTTDDVEVDDDLKEHLPDDVVPTRNN